MRAPLFLCKMAGMKNGWVYHIHCLSLPIIIHQPRNNTLFISPVAPLYQADFMPFDVKLMCFAAHLLLRRLEHKRPKQMFGYLVRVLLALLMVQRSVGQRLFHGPP